MKQSRTIFHRRTNDNRDEVNQCVIKRKKDAKLEKKNPEQCIADRRK